MEEIDVGIICVKIYDDLALQAWTQRERNKERRSVQESMGEKFCVCVCVCECVCVCVCVCVCLCSFHKTIIASHL